MELRKIVIIGAGHVGSHAGYALLSQGLAEQIVFIDVDEPKARAQALDLTDATAYLPKRAQIWAGDYRDARDAQLIVVAAGPLPTMQQTRMDTLGQTVAIIKQVAQHIQSSGFDGIILNISNPADVVTQYLQHVLDWNPRHILSTSTTLDSARLRRALSEATGFDQKSICAYALGEHGESQMVAWSAVSIAGKPLHELRREQPDTWGKLDLAALATEGRRGGWHILGGKGSTEFGIGASIAEVVRALFGDERRVLPVSVLLEGQYGQNGVYASVPAVLGKNGVEQIIELQLTADEQALFAASCAAIKQNYELALTL